MSIDIPVVFAFDKNFLVPAAVAIGSLLANSKEEQYTIFCLHNSSVTETDLNWLLKLRDKYNNCEFRLMERLDEFSGSHTIEYISYVTYYRFLIPDLFPEYDKIIYADVDMVFQGNLRRVWQEDISEYYIGGVKDDWLFYDDFEYMKQIGFENDLYVNAGFLLMNLKKLRQDNISKRWFPEAYNTDHRYSDQDIINETCKGFIKRLPLYANFCSCNFNPKCLLCKERGKEVELAIRFGNLHFTGKKPWWKGVFTYPEELAWWNYYWKLPSGKQKQLSRYTMMFVRKKVTPCFFHLRKAVGKIRGIIFRNRAPK